MPATGNNFAGYAVHTTDYRVALGSNAQPRFLAQRRMQFVAGRPECVGVRVCNFTSQPILAGTFSTDSKPFTKTVHVLPLTANGSWIGYGEDD